MLGRLTGNRALSLVHSVTMRLGWQFFSQLAAENPRAGALPQYLASTVVTAHQSIADALGLKKALLVLPETNEKVELSARNIPGITIMTPAQLSVYEILRHPQLILLEGAVAPVEARLK